MWVRRSQKPVPVFSTLLSRSIIDPARTVVLDPCCGTASSGLAALGLGCAGFLGFDLDAAIIPIAQERIATFLNEPSEPKGFYNSMCRLVTWRVMVRRQPVFTIADNQNGVYIFFFLCDIHECYSHTFSL
jgi:hypothetical protein